MEAEELMIGDWVQIVPDAPVMTNEYHRIDWIRTGEIGLDNRKIVTYPYIQPIPLTPEILEKNKMREFEHRNPGQGDNLIKKWWHKDGSYYVSLYMVGDKYTYTVGDSITRVCRIKYVHELQHVLRLCGIKDIEL